MRKIPSNDSLYCDEEIIDFIRRDPPMDNGDNIQLEEGSLHSYSIDEHLANQFVYGGITPIITGNTRNPSPQLRDPDPIGT